jgi:signal transduction histidine kinase
MGMDTRALPDLERPVRQWRRIAYSLVSAGALAGFVLGPDPRRAAMVVVFLLALATSGMSGRVTIRVLLLTDLAVSVAVWWLYGPISGAAFIALGVVAVGPFLMGARQARMMVGAALLTVPVEVGLHFLAGEVALPLFHPPGPVPTSEFLAGEAIQAGLFLGIGILMAGVAGMLRRGQQALADDLDRERELSLLKDRFVATVSHQLRTPLTTLKGFTRMLLDDDVSQPEQHEFLTIMADQAEELHAVVEDVLTFSRIGAGSLTISATSVDLRELTSSVLSGLGIRAREVSNQVQPGTTVQADSPRSGMSCAIWSTMPSSTVSRLSSYGLGHRRPGPLSRPRRGARHRICRGGTRVRAICPTRRGRDHVRAWVGLGPAHRPRVGDGSRWRDPIRARRAHVRVRVHIALR